MVQAGVSRKRPVPPFDVMGNPARLLPFVHADSITEEGDSFLPPTAGYDALDRVRDGPACSHSSPPIGRAFLIWLIGLIFFLFAGLSTEAEAVRPPLKPLNKANLERMAADADLIAAGTVTAVTRTKTSEPPLETVTIHAVLKARKILKGSEETAIIDIEESFRQYATGIAESPGSDTGRAIAAHTMGPSPPVGRYKEGAGVIVFLKKIEGRSMWKPLGSGDYDAYLGVFQVGPGGVAPTGYMFDEALSGIAVSEAGFIDFIISTMGGRR